MNSAVNTTINPDEKPIGFVQVDARLTMAQGFINRETGEIVKFTGKHLQLLMYGSQREAYFRSIRKNYFDSWDSIFLKVTGSQYIKNGTNRQILTDLLKVGLVVTATSAKGNVKNKGSKNFYIKNIDELLKDWSLVTQSMEEFNSDEAKQVRKEEKQARIEQSQAKKETPTSTSIFDEFAAKRLKAEIDHDGLQDEEDLNFFGDDYVFTGEQETPPKPTFEDEPEQPIPTTCGDKSRLLKCFPPNTDISEISTEDKGIGFFAGYLNNPNCSRDTAREYLKVISENYWDQYNPDTTTIAKLVEWLTCSECTDLKDESGYCLNPNCTDHHSNIPF